MIRATFLWVLVSLILMKTSSGQDCEEVGCSPGSCCSKWGFCGDSELHCQPRVIDTPGDTNDSLCDPPCRPGQCCSKWGFCGNSELHCPETVTNRPGGTSESLCDPPCRPGQCCSKWGSCGNSELHCQETVTNRPGGTSDSLCNPPCRPDQCCSKWGSCGDSPLHCAGSGTQTTRTTTRPTTTTTRTTTSTTMRTTTTTTTTTTTMRTTTTTTLKTTTTTKSGGDDTKITREQFDCIFSTLSKDVRDKRWQGYQEALSIASFKPQSQNELVMFFAHVAHETDGLQTYEEYCGKSGACADDYQSSWCPPVKGEPGKKYYGRGWFQLSWPCNYNAAGQALGIDLLKNPEKVAESDAVAAATGMWFWTANGMGAAARGGNFAATTKLINSIECGPTPQQTSRINRYQEVRVCFGLEKATENLRC